MKKVIKKTKMYKYDVQTVKKAWEFLTEKFMRGDYGESKETIQEFISILENVLESLKSEEIDVERKVRESEDEARQYFGEDFVRRFEQIRKYCTENNLMLAIHGTNPQLLDSIRQNGLEYKFPEILSTALIQTGTDLEETYSNFSGLLNWSHKESKGLILLGIPSECNGVLSHGEKETKPLWLRISQEGDYEKKYRINPEFIIGQIDVEKKVIQDNPTFSLIHDYSGLEYDYDLTNYKRKMSVTKENVEKTTEDVDKGQTDVTQENISQGGEKSSKELLTDIANDFCNPLSVLIRSKGEMEESDITEYIESIKQTIIILRQLEPQLRENQEITDELEIAEKEMQQGTKVDAAEWDDIEWDDDFDRENGDDSFRFFIADVEENISQKATISGINQETQYIKSKKRDRNKSEIGIARDEEWN